VNRNQRRKARVLRVGDVIATMTVSVVFDTPDRERALYWVVVPDGMSKEEAWATQRRHGPFRTDAEVTESQRVTLFGEQCKVTEGGMWDPAWNNLQ
jgi:hypothetical protein